MEIKGKIKEISISETQAKVKLEDGFTCSSNEPAKMEAVRQLSEGDVIVADVFSRPGRAGTQWAKYNFWNINNIGLDLPVIQREDELKEPEKPVEPKTTVDAPTDMPETEKERDEALAANPEYMIMEIGRIWLQLLTTSKEYFKAFK